MRVMHVITSLDVGGAERMLVRLLPHLERAGVGNEVVTLRSGGALAGEVNALGVPLRELRVETPLSSAAGLVRLRRAIRESRPDVVQSWLYHADLLAALATRPGKRPALAWNLRCSDVDMSQFAWTSRAVLRANARLSRRADVVVVNSRLGRSVHESMGYRPRAWQFIPNGFDLDAFQPRPDARETVRASLGIPPDAPLVGMVARVDPTKDHAAFLEGASLLLAARPDAHFVLVGRGTQRLATSSPCIHALGERRDIASLLPSFDVATLASHTEGFPNAVAEAMACGVPCVVTDAGEAAEIVGETGIVAPRGDAAGLAKGWEQILVLAPAERARLGRAARARIAERYSIEAIAKEYADVYRALGASA